MRIDELMGSIDEKNRHLKFLLKEKAKIINKIQTMMDFLAMTRTPLNEEQMESFASFTGLYAEEASYLQETLRKIDNQVSLNTTKKELLHKEADYSIILDELTSFKESQESAITVLRSIIDSGYRTLQAL
ncbi:MAG: hypothetical protein LBT59_14735 [Clostridiales bacterium]|nr:hypothetical protein [Clostridiales bacterium]